MLDYHLQRLLGRATCRLGSGARLLRTARIRNIRGDSDCIAIGANSIIRGELLTFAHGGKIEIGSWCYVGEGSRIWSGSLVQIGNRVLIAHGVNIFDSLTHPIDPRRTSQANSGHFHKGPSSTDRLGRATGQDRGRCLDRCRCVRYARCKDRCSRYRSGGFSRHEGCRGRHGCRRQSCVSRKVSS